MLSDGAAVAIFAVPTAVFLVGGVALASATRSTDAIGLIVTIVLGLGALCFLFAQSVARKHAQEYEPRFRALAERLGGEVVRNLLGEIMLRVPHPRGWLELEYCVYDPDGESREPYTRLALALPAGSLPKVRRDMLEKPSAANELGPATRADVAALPGKARLLGRGRAPSVEVWTFGWLDEREAPPIVEEARPLLEALASRPWTA